MHSKQNGDGGRDRETPDADRRVLIVVNPVAGDGEDPSDAIESRMKEIGVDFEIRTTRKGGDALSFAESAAADGFDLVVAVGGDGTLAEVVSGVIRSGDDLPVAFLPRGTANAFAQVTRIPDDLDDATALLQEGIPVRFDVGYLPAQNRHFLLMAGVGLPARVVTSSNRAQKNRWGVLSYLGSVLGQLKHLRAARFRIEIDGNVQLGYGHSLFVLNTGKLDELGLDLPDDVTPHNGKFLFALARGNRTVDVMMAIFDWVTRRRHGRGLRQTAGVLARIETRPALPFQVDGDVLGHTPVTVELLPGAVRVLVPREYADDTDQSEEDEEDEKTRTSSGKILPLPRTRLQPAVRSGSPDSAVELRFRGE